MPDFQSMLDSFNSPPTRHAMFVHLPITLTFVGFVLALLAAILRKNKTCRALAIAGQVALGGAAYFTLTTGDNAQAAISVALSPEVDAVLMDHEDLANMIWMFAAGVTVLLTLSAALRGAAATICAWLGVIGSIATIVLVSATAHNGGKLVYEYGLGTPNPVRASTSVNPPATPPPSSADAATTGPSATAPGEAPDEPVTAQVAFFRDEAFPILSEHCFNCHNAARVASRKSGLLDQTSREALLKGGRSGPAIEPGKPDDSLLVHRLRGSNPDKDMMPPGGQLPEKDIAIIEQWIRDGAVWVDPAGQ